MSEGQVPYSANSGTTTGERRAVVTDHLKIDVEHLSEQAPIFAKELEKLLTELDSTVAWLKISNVRLRAQSLKMQFERIDGLLGQLEEQTREV